MQTFADTLFHLLYLGCLGFGLYAIHETIVDMKENIADLMRAQHDMNVSIDHLYIKHVETMQDAVYLTCGGCGKTVPASDGWRPDDHDCDAPQFDEYLEKAR